MSGSFVTAYNIVMYLKHEIDCAEMDDATQAAIKAAAHFVDDVQVAAANRGIKLEIKVDYMYTIAEK